jgi:putative membrane protein
MEDLPHGLASLIIREAEKLGLPFTLVVDAHNSIDGPFKPDEAIQSLGNAAVASLKEASSSMRSSFEMGAAKVVPAEFGVREGMGPGGISVIVIEMGGQKAAYVTIDGNNMISGLREKILAMLQGIGIADGEVLTTDTHAVTGIIPTARGYHPVGEVINHAKLVGYVEEVATKAIANLRPAYVSMRTRTIPNINVIGEKAIEGLSILVNETMKRAKKLAVSLFSATAILLISLLVPF